MSARKIDFAGLSWAAHSQEPWLEFAGNPNFPDYLRIMFVAYGRHAANGHAKLNPGELSRYLVRKDGTLPDRRGIWGSIQTAIKHGYLHPFSRTLCLVVSSDHVQGGVGNPDAPCRRDHTKRSQDVRSEAGRFVQDVRDDAGRLELNVRDEYGRSTNGASVSLHPEVNDGWRTG